MISKRSYELGFKKTVIQHYRGGWSVKTIAEMTGISFSTIYRWLDEAKLRPKKFDDTKDIELAMKGYYRPSLLTKIRNYIKPKGRIK